MIGLKSLAALATASLAVAAGARFLEPGTLASLDPATCLAIGLVATLAAALLAVGWRPKDPSRVAIGLRGAAIAREPPFELPAPVQLALFAVAFVCAGLAALDNQSTERLTGLPAALATPSPSSTCRPVEAARPAPAPAPAPADIPGCALIRRAYELGYAKSLGSCAPGANRAPEPPALLAAPAPCDLRQEDEPFLHFAWRRLIDRTKSVATAEPIQKASSGAHAIGIELDYLDTLAAHQLHAVAATRHASHHLWVNLPPPEEATWLRGLLGPPPCAPRYERAAAWPRAGTPSALVDHVLGQLLFAPGYAVAPAQCGDYVVHWDAPPDACQRLAADPLPFLAATAALDDVRDVLDRRRRRLELGRLDAALGRRPTVDPPPDAPALVSLQCLIVDAAGPAGLTAYAIAIDGQPIAVRELRAPSIEVAGAGPIDVYERMARLLAGQSPGPLRADAAPLAPVDLTRSDYLLTRLDPLRDADPFGGARWPLEQPDLDQVYPFHRHIHRFVDDFRRRYAAQRGRL